MGAPVVYMVRFWVSPDAEQELIDGIDNGHHQEAIDQPGFRWGQRLVLEARDEQGWQGYLNLYGVESRAAFEANQASEIQPKFQQEAARFAEHMRIERGFAEMALSVMSRTRSGVAA